MKKTALVVIFLLVSTMNVVADPPDAAYIARLLYAADERADCYPDILRINPGLDEPLLYQVQRHYIELRRAGGDEIGGYKGGFIPKGSIGAALWQRGIRHGDAVVDTKDFRNLLVEAEIGFRLCATLTERLPDVAALKAATCEVFPAIELPDAAFDDLAGLRADFPRLRRLLIPTNMGAAGVLIGQPLSQHGIDLDRLDVRVEHDGKQIGFRDGAQANDDIWSRVLWTINEYVIARGYDITPAHIIIPGALTGLHPGSPGRYTVSYGALGTVSFEIR